MEGVHVFCFVYLIEKVKKKKKKKEKKEEATMIKVRQLCSQLQLLMMRKK